MIAYDLVCLRRHGICLPYDFDFGIVLSFERCPIPYYIFYVCGNDCRSWEKIHEKVGLKIR